MRDPIASSCRFITTMSSYLHTLEVISCLLCKRQPILSVMVRDDVMNGTGLMKVERSRDADVVDNRSENV